MKIRKPRIKKDLKAYGGKIRTIEIEESLSRFFDMRKCLIVPNISWGFHGGHEIDLFVLKPSNYAVEIEIKISKSDFLADFKKDHHHESRYIREFYYAMPKELYVVIKDQIPLHAGVITCERTLSGLVNSHVVKEPKANSKSVKLTDADRLRISRLGTMRIWTLKKKIISLQNEKLLLSLQKEKKPTIKK